MFALGGEVAELASVTLALVLLLKLLLFLGTSD